MAIKSITMTQFFDLIAESINEENIKSALAKGHRVSNIPEGCDAVAVSYLSNTSIIIVNPVAWAKTSYYTSPKTYTIGAYKMKVMVGEAD